MAGECFCHFNGYEVKDAAARQKLIEIDGRVEALELGGGSGESSGAVTVQSCADCNNAQTAGFYHMVAPMTNAPTEFTTNAVLLVEHNPNGIQQTITDGNMSAKRNYNTWLSTWNPWEYVNPPMENGVAYRTTERYKGYPVYAVSVILGSIMSAGTLTVTIPSVSIESPNFTVVDISAVHMDAESAKDNGCYYNAISFFDLIAVNTAASPLQVRAKRNSVVDYAGVISETRAIIKFVYADLDSAYA